MTDRTAEQEKLYQDTRKVTLECAALERNVRTEPLKTGLALLAAFAFVFSFALDRYKVSEQRRHDRKVVVATEFDTLVSRTLTAVTKASSSVILLQLNVKAYKEKLEQLGNRARSHPQPDELRLFVAEGIAFADQFLKNHPEHFEFTQWTNAIEIESAWASREKALTPDFESLFGKALAAEWVPLREKALAAVHTKFSFVDTTDPKKLTEFREAAARFQSGLQQALE